MAGYVMNLKDYDDGGTLRITGFDDIEHRPGL
jgi:hypothetical protein